MRHTPIIGEKAWFGPKTWGGWGWQPATWEGWVSTAAVLGASLGAGAAFERTIGIAVTFFFVGLLGALCYLKGTSPGGAVEHEQLRIRRRGFPGGAEGQRAARRRAPDEPSVREAGQRLQSWSDSRPRRDGPETKGDA